eukprot:14028479-Alexandrium_andersonii.AAC.1
MPGGPIACPRCGEPYQRDRAFREYRNITRFNEVLVFHSDREGRPYPRDHQGLLVYGQALVYPIWWDEAAYGQATAVFPGVLNDVHRK